MNWNTILALAGTGLVLAAKYGLIVLAVGYLVAKLVKVADAYADRAKEEGKRVKLARVFDSVAHFLAVGAQAEAQAVQKALAEGKSAPEVGSVALQVVKDNLKTNGLKELQEILGIVAGDVFEAHLAVLAKDAASRVAPVPH